MEGTQGWPVGCVGIGKRPFDGHKAQGRHWRGTRVAFFCSHLLGLASPSKRLGSTRSWHSLWTPACHCCFPTLLLTTEIDGKVFSLILLFPVYTSFAFPIPEAHDSLGVEMDSKHCWAPASWEEAAGLWRGCWAGPHPAEHAGDRGQTSVSTDLLLLTWSMLGNPGCM